jgi:hypothetical protein
MTDTPIDVERLIALCDRIRWDYVNERRVHTALYADNARFRQVCSAMDMITDTSQALRSYGQLCATDVDLGIKYLGVFGALQVLYVQQDAVFWLCKNLGFPTAVAAFSGPDKWIRAKGNEALCEVRNLRHSSVGHPVNRQKGAPDEIGSYFIVQGTLSLNGFQMVFADDAGQREFIDVPVFALVQTQIVQLEATLQTALDEIAMSEQQHRDTFKAQRLETIFTAIEYPIAKMHEAVCEVSFRPVGTHHVERVQNAMATFRAKLDERGEPFRADLQLIYDQLNVALPRLTDFYAARADDSPLADVLATFVRDRVDELREWARSMDESYAREHGTPDVD